MIAFLLAACLWLPPVPGQVVAGFEPGDGYAGHWGVDVAAPVGSEVRAPVEGVVTFAGSVAGMRSVTILVDPDVRVSLSYLKSIEVTAGEPVTAGAVVGRSGRAHGEDRLHMSVRVGDRYVDPAPYFACRSRPGGTIRLLPDR